MSKTLIVDDNTAFRKMLREVLLTRFPTMNIEEERDGSELFLRIDTFHPDIIFMDIDLPGESGLELTKRIKMNYPDIVVAILTGYDLPEFRQVATQSKVDYFLPKSSPIQDFLSLVECILPKNTI